MINYGAKPKKTKNYFQVPPLYCCLQNSFTCYQDHIKEKYWARLVSFILKDKMTTLVWILWRCINLEDSSNACHYRYNRNRECYIFRTRPNLHCWRGYIQSVHWQCPQNKIFTLISLVYTDIHYWSIFGWSE